MRGALVRVYAKDETNPMHQDPFWIRPPPAHRFNRCIQHHGAPGLTLSLKSPSIFRFNQQVRSSRTNGSTVLPQSNGSSIPPEKAGEAPRLAIHTGACHRNATNFDLTNDALDRANQWVPPTTAVVSPQPGCRPRHR